MVGAVEAALIVLEQQVDDEAQTDENEKLAQSVFLECLSGRAIAPLAQMQIVHKPRAPPPVQSAGLAASRFSAAAAAIMPKLEVTHTEEPKPAQFRPWMRASSGFSKHTPPSAAG